MEQKKMSIETINRFRKLKKWGIRFWLDKDGNFVSDPTTKYELIKTDSITVGKKYFTESRH